MVVEVVAEELDAINRSEGLSGVGKVSGEQNWTGQLVKLLGSSAFGLSHRPNWTG